MDSPFPFWVCVCGAFKGKILLMMGNSPTPSSLSSTVDQRLSVHLDHQPSSHIQ